MGDGMIDDGYIDKVNRFQEIVDRHIPEVLPEYQNHDGWNGAAGVEIRSEDVYMPYPHLWDSTMDWCSIRTWGIIMKDGGEPGVGILEVHPDLIPNWIYRRAIGQP
jgi:hypothetical protein